MTRELLVGDSGTWLSPDASIDADLSDDRWFHYVPAAHTVDEDVPPPGATPPSGIPIQQDVPNLDDKPAAGTVLDAWAADILMQAWQELFGTVPSPKALLAAQAIARLESTYGWPSEKRNPEWQGHHNWGSVHCMMRVDGKLKSCMQDGVCVHGFLSTDKINGVRTPVCFASFPTNVAGAKHFLTQLLIRRPNVMAVIDSGDAYLIALEMRKTTYFVGENTRDPEKMKAEAAKYASGIIARAKDIAKARGVPMSLTITGPEKIAPTDPDKSSWPRDVTDMAGAVEPSTASSTLGPIAGVLVGVGLGVLGVWGYKKWFAEPGQLHVPAKASR